jgi:type IV secretion system protein VirD4
MGEQETFSEEERQQLDKLLKLVLRGYFWSGKVTWKFLRWTGLWVAALILALDAGLQTVGVPGDIWGLPFLLSLGFAACWTGWKLYQKSQGQSTARQMQAPESGVFFGLKEEMKQSVILPASWWGGTKASSEPVTKAQDADGHVLVVGGAGSGKSSCIAIPTLRDYWRAAALVVDIKGELYEKSRRPRAYVFNPLKADALGYDPFYLLRGSENPLPDIREIALTLCPMEASVKDPFWIQAAQNVLTGHLIFGWKSGASFSETIEVLQSVPPKKLLATESKDAQACRYLLDFGEMDNRTLASIMVELSNKVVAFATDPHIAATLSKQDIVTPELLEQGGDVFLQLPEYKLQQWKPMISLIVQQFSRHFEKRPDEGATPILFLLDEFARLGKMEAVVHGLATLRSKKITIMPIIQSLAQLDASYGQDERKIICDNCSYKAILNATDADTQAYFSKLVGTYEKEKVTTSYEGTGWLAEEKSMSKTTEDKPIIKPEEFAYLKDIVLLTPDGYTRVQKRPYYLEEPALVRAQAAATTPTRAQPTPSPRETAGFPPRNRNSSPSPASAVPPLTPPAASATSQTSQQGYQGNQGSQMETAAPQAAQPPPNLAAQFETALTQLTQSAQAGTPLKTLAQDFAARMSPALRRQFEVYWQQRQQRQQREQPTTGVPVQDENPSARYEAAFTLAVRYAPAGTSLTQVALQFAEPLPPAEQASFLAWWVRKQQAQAPAPAGSKPPPVESLAAGTSPMNVFEARELAQQSRQVLTAAPPEDASARYEAALQVAAHYAQPDTALTQVAHSFAETLPAAERATFLVWWQQRQQREQAAEASTSNASPAAAERKAGA